MRAQEHAPGLGELDIEGVERAAGGMVLGDVQRLEVAPARFDLGALGDLVSHAYEDVFERLAHLGHEMEVTCQATRQHLGQIQAVRGKPLGSAKPPRALSAGCRRAISSLPRSSFKHPPDLAALPQEPSIPAAGTSRQSATSSSERRCARLPRGLSRSDAPLKRGRRLSFEVGDLVGKVGGHDATCRRLVRRGHQTC